MVKCPYPAGEKIIFGANIGYPRPMDRDWIVNLSTGISQIPNKATFLINQSWKPKTEIDRSSGGGGGRQYKQYQLHHGFKLLHSLMLQPNKTMLLTFYLFF